MFIHALSTLVLTLGSTLAFANSYDQVPNPSSSFYNAKLIELAQNTTPNSGNSGYTQQTGRLCAPGSMDSVCTGNSVVSSCVDEPSTRETQCSGGLFGKEAQIGTKNSCTGNFVVSGAPDQSGCTDCNAQLSEDELLNIQYVLMSQVPAYNQYVLKKYAQRNGYSHISQVPDGSKIDIQVKVASAGGVSVVASTKPLGRSFREFIYMPKTDLKLPTFNRIKYLSQSNQLPIIFDTSDPDFPVSLLPRGDDGKIITDILPIYQALAETFQTGGLCDLISTSGCQRDCNVSTTLYEDNLCTAGQLQEDVQPCFTAWKYINDTGERYVKRIRAPWAGQGSYTQTNWAIEIENQWMGRPQTVGGPTFVCSSTFETCRPFVPVSRELRCRTYGEEICQFDKDGNPYGCYRPCIKTDFWVTTANQCKDTQRSFWAEDEPQCANFVDPAENGVCGPLNGQVVDNTPTGPLACSTGNQINLVYDGKENYTWECSGKDGGSNALCSAKQKKKCSTAVACTPGEVMRVQSAPGAGDYRVDACQGYDLFAFTLTCNAEGTWNKPIITTITKYEGEVPIYDMNGGPDSINKTHYVICDPGAYLALDLNTQCTDASCSGDFMLRKMVGTINDQSPYSATKMPFSYNDAYAPMTISVLYNRSTSEICTTTNALQTNTDCPATTLTWTGAGGATCSGQVAGAVTGTQTDVAQSLTFCSTYVKGTGTKQGTCIDNSNDSGAREYPCTLPDTDIQGEPTFQGCRSDADHTKLAAAYLRQNPMIANYPRYSSIDNTAYTRDLSNPQHRSGFADAVCKDGSWQITNAVCNTNSITKCTNMTPEVVPFGSYQLNFYNCTYNDNKVIDFEIFNTIYFGDQNGGG